MSEDNEPQEIKRHPDNAPGDFYVVCDECISCEAPCGEAPDLMGAPDSSKKHYGCYFKKQPVTEEEIDRACDAVQTSCIEAVRYAGNDPEILRKLEERGSEFSCDVLHDNNPWDDKTDSGIFKRFLNWLLAKLAYFK